MIRRRHPLRPGRPPVRKPLRWRPKQRETSPEDRARLMWLHDQRCCAPGHDHCQHRVVVHHDTHARGLGQKAPHSRGMPLCPRSHEDFHAGRGPFLGWAREQRRAWQAEMVARYQAAWERRTLRDIVAP